MLWSHSGALWLRLFHCLFPSCVWAPLETHLSISRDLTLTLENCLLVWNAHRPTHSHICLHSDTDRTSLSSWNTYLTQSDASFNYFYLFLPQCAEGACTWIYFVWYRIYICRYSKSRPFNSLCWQGLRLLSWFTKTMNNLNKICDQWHDPLLPA